MTFVEVVKQVLISQGAPMTPQEIRDKIITEYPVYYGTESHKKNVERGHYQNIDHALLAQIYSVVKTNDSFFCDRTTKPMKISIVEENEEETPEIEDYENDEGIVYVLKTNTFTRDGKEIIKIGFTTQDINRRISQLYTTGVPFEFQPYKIFQTRNFIELEQALHKLLSPYRINKSREFYKEGALKHLEKICEIHNIIQNEA